eukprot:9050172-Pyramimonas_sp.AAC.2
MAFVFLRVFLHVDRWVCGVAGPGRRRVGTFKNQGETTFQWGDDDQSCPGVSACTHKGAFVGMGNNSVGGGSDVGACFRVSKPSTHIAVL